MAAEAIHWHAATGEAVTHERVTTIRHAMRSHASTAAVLAVLKFEAPHCLTDGRPAVEPIDLDTVH